MVQVMHHFGFGLPNHGQEVTTLKRLLQESSRTSCEYTFLVCSPITPGQDNNWDGREM
jgi:hypothetical protein